MMDIVNCTLTIIQKFLKFKHWQMSKSELIIKVRVQVDNLIERNVKKQRISTIQSHENLYLVFIKKYLIFMKRNYLVFMKTIIWFSWKQNDLVFIKRNYLVFMAMNATCSGCRWLVHILAQIATSSLFVDYQVTCMSKQAKLIAQMPSNIFFPPLPPSSETPWEISNIQCLNRQSFLPKCPAIFSSLLFLLLLRDHEKYPMSNV